MNLAKRLEIPKLVKKCKSIVQGDIVLPSLPSVEKLFSESGTQSENAEALAAEAIILVSPEQRQMENVACPLNSHDRQEIAELPQVSSTTQMNGNDLPSEELPLVPTENAASQQQQVDIGENIVLQDDSMLVSVDASHLENERVEEDRFEAVSNGFKCKSCRQTFPSKEETLRHIKALHSLHFTCPVCQRPFTNQHNLRRHMMIKHSDEADKKFECDVCGKRYAIKQSLDYHMKKTHKTHDNDEEEEIKRVEEDYTRQSARPEFGLEEALEELSRHEDPQEEQSIQYRSISSNLIPNTISAHTSSLLSDPLASYLNPVSTLAQSAPSIQMMASSLPTPMPFEVPVQQHDHGESVPTLTMLTPAPITQSAMKPYQMYHFQNQCDFCKKIFNNSLEYQKHKKRCNKHKCKHCNRAFSQLGNLRRHVTILHSGDKPYKCSMCSKAYSIKQSLRYHMHHTHGIYESSPVDPENVSKYSQHH